jgi:hypothetical protein
LAAVAIAIEVLFLPQYIILSVILARAVRLDGVLDHVTAGLLTVQIANAFAVAWLIWILLRFLNGLPPFTVESLAIKLAFDGLRVGATTYFMYYLLTGRAND